MARLLVRLALWLVPRSWRESVARDLEEEARAGRHGALWRAWHMARAGLRLRPHFGLDAFTTDVRYAVRSLLRAKGFTAVSIATFALGIGLTVAVFGVLDRLMFRPLPYQQPERLVQIHTAQFGGATSGLLLAQAMGHAVSERATTIGPLAYARAARGAEDVDGFGSRLVLATSSANLLEVLGVVPVLGRGFSQEAAPAGSPTELILTFEAWQSRFGGSRDVLDRVVGGARRYRIVGVLPPGFLLPSSEFIERLDGLRVEPSQLSGPVRPGLLVPSAVARLEGDATVPQAQAEVEALAGALRQETPSVRDRETPLVIQPLQQGLAVVYRTYLWLIVGAAALVWALACVNLSTLFVARGQARRVDVAVRAALGAGGSRLALAAIVETALVCLASAAIAVASYAASRQMILAVVPPVFRGFAVPGFDPRLATLAVVAALATGVVTALVSLVAVRRCDVSQLLSMSTRTGGARRRGLRALLVVEAAFGVLLVAGAAASARSFAGLVLTDPGFTPRNLHYLSVQHGWNRNEASIPSDRVNGILEIVRTMPTVETAGAVHALPVGNRAVDGEFWEARGRDDGALWGISAGVFEALRTPLRAGRPFSEEEVDTAALVAIVNESGARVLWPDVPANAAVGRTVRTADGLRTIVAVVADIRRYPGEAPRPSLFVPITAADVPMQMSAVGVVARTIDGQAPDRTVLLDRLNARFGRNNVPMANVERDLAEWLYHPRFLAALFGALALVAGVLSAVGLYAVASFEVSRRRYEMGVRAALGATARNLRRLIVGDACRAVAAVASCGIVAAWWALQYLQSLLFEVDARDPATLALAVAVLLVTAILAAWLPAYRAGRTDPAEVLRAQ